MLTHDLEPIIDMVYVKKDVFSQSTVASFLENNGGKIIEVPIVSSDIISFSKICAEVIKSDEDEVVKLIHLRRLFEVNYDYNLSYQLLSSLFHKKDIPTFKEFDQERVLSDTEISEATATIKEKIPTFDYMKMLARIKDDKEMEALYGKIQSRQSKLQIFRIIKAGSSTL